MSTRFLKTRAVLLLSVLLCPALSLAATLYRLDRSSATAGQAVTLTAIQTNDTTDATTWQPPAQLTVHWLQGTGEAIQAEAQPAPVSAADTTETNASLAERDAGATGQPSANATPSAQHIGPGRFATKQWTLTVPETLNGATTLQIDGYDALLALSVNTADATGPAGAGKVVAVDDTAAVAMGARTPQTSELAAGTPPTTETAGPFSGLSRAISTYEPIYFDIGNNDGADARFQISLKYRLFSPDTSANERWYHGYYVGYTQTSLWDLAGASKPFVDSTYNPSVFWHPSPLWVSPDQRWTAGLNTGLEHQSNGKSGPDSRSINDYYLQPEIGHQFAGGSVLTFMPRIRTYFNKDENPDYADYAGYVDWKLRWAQPEGLVLTGLYRQGKHGRYTAQLEAAWPLKRTFLDMNGYLHIQYFRGYGQTLLGYREDSSPQVRIGLSLVP